MRIMNPLLCCVLLAGCGQASYRSAPPTSASKSDGGGETSTGELAGATEVAAIVATAERKIIYTATVELQVERFDEVPQKVQAVVRSHEGYIARSEIHGVPGRPRQGHWTVRIPVIRYEEFLASARSLGEVRSVTTDSEDVSEEYYDVEARIRNKKEAEKRLLAHLEQTTAKLDDILAVERELARVREEIERMEGRLRYLKDRTSLTTVELFIDEVGQYDPEEAAAYTTRLRRTWQASLQSICGAGQSVFLAIVFLAPWLAVLCAAGLMLRIVWRLMRRQKPTGADSKS